MDTIIINNPNSKKNVKNNNVAKKDVIVYKDNIHNLIKYSIYNPPFFKKIIIQDFELSEDNLKKIYNLCSVN